MMAEFGYVHSSAPLARRKPGTVLTLEDGTTRCEFGKVCLVHVPPMVRRERRRTGRKVLALVVVFAVIWMVMW